MLYIRSPEIVRKFGGHFETMASLFIIIMFNDYHIIINIQDVLKLIRFFIITGETWMS